MDGSGKNQTSIEYNPDWRPARAGLSRDALQALFAGTIPAIHIADGATLEECRRFCRALGENADRARAASTSPMQIIGGNLSNFRGHSKAQYFADAEKGYRDIELLTRASFDPLQRIIEQLNAIWPGAARVAVEPGYGRYFAGGVKSRTQGSQLHFDYIPRFASHFAIAGIVDQIAWNLYLEVPCGTGDTTIFNAPVARRERACDDPVWDNKLDPQAVAGCQCYRFRPRVGELVMFNTRFPHSIAVDNPLPNERRTQIGSFIGRMADDSLHLWS